MLFCEVCATIRSCPLEHLHDTGHKAALCPVSGCPDRPACERKLCCRRQCSSSNVTVPEEPLPQRPEPTASATTAPAVAEPEPIVAEPEPAPARGALAKQLDAIKVPSFNRPYSLHYNHGVCEDVVRPGQNAQAATETPERQWRTSQTTPAGQRQLGGRSWRPTPRRQPRWLR